MREDGDDSKEGCCGRDEGPRSLEEDGEVGRAVVGVRLELDDIVGNGFEGERAECCGGQGSFELARGCGGCFWECEAPVKRCFWGPEGNGGYGNDKKGAEDRGLQTKTDRALRGNAADQRRPPGCHYGNGRVYGDANAALMLLNAIRR